MVERTHARCLESGIECVSASRMDAQKLDVADGTFDAAICALGLMYVPDTRAAIAEMARMVRPGGTVAATVWGERKNCGWAEIFPIVEKRVTSEVCPLFFQLGGGDALRWTLEGAGFTDVAVERISTTLDYADGDEACGAAFAGGPVALAYARFDEPTVAEAHAEYLASIEAHRHGAGYAVPGEFVVARGRRAAGR